MIEPDYSNPPMTTEYDAREGPASTPRRADPTCHCGDPLSAHHPGSSCTFFVPMDEDEYEEIDS